MNSPITAAHTGPSASERSPAGFDLSPLSAEQYQRLTGELTPDERAVILEHGTEAPFCGVFNEAKAAGNRRGEQEDRLEGATAAAQTV